ncbi:Sensor histidine kinase YpdA [Blautia producta]|uniref:Sensor histidine kinase YpdA n=1 Tax=Blautia producta TaxID=33035 RepID=A0A4P6LX43_9FIRM|nr:histidine kinase [Blautia producta]QBE96355.1 Sensor histidine kinase YpdA [Blautia producta]
MKWKGIYSHRIFTQLVVFTLLISLIPTLSITSFLFYKLENMVKTELSNSYLQMTSQYIKNIDEKLTQYQYSLDVIADNTVILEALVNQTESPYIKGEQISSEVTKSLLLDRQKEIRNCMLYSDIDEYPVYGKRASMVKEAGHEEWFLQERAIKEGGFSYISSAGNVPVLSFVKNIEDVNIHNYEKKQLGFLKLDLYMDLIFRPAATANEGDSSYEVIVFSDDNKILYSSAPGKNFLLNTWLGSQDTSELIDGFTIKQEHLKGCSLNVLLLFDSHQLKAKQQAVRQMVLPIMLCVTLLILFWSWLYSRNFSARVGCLVQKFHTAETGDLNIYGPIAGNDEIAELDRQFSHMLGKLDSLIQKNYIRELENKKAQLKNLQLQINPHFLYNTLETISSMAAVKQVFDICDICQKLGEIFRYNLGKNYGEFVTVAQELGHVQNYIFIIKKRYGNRFEVFYNISIDTDNAMTLRFILQPIVENAILHGLVKQTTTGTLELSVWEEEDSLMIRVEDDGVGMDIQKVEELNRSIHVADNLTKTGLNIGIRNVNQRIKLACGDQYGITIKSTLHYGSQFDIRLPLIRKGEQTDENKPADSR